MFPLIFLILSISTLSNATRKEILNSHRLPRTLKPLHYTITTEPSLATSTFSGNVSITLNVLETTKTITLHSENLKLLSTPTVYYGQGAIKVKTYQLEKSRHFLHIHLEEEIYEDERIKLDLHYSGTLNTNNKGFYRANYKDAEDISVWFSMTHFEATFARQAFPCFDEPNLKANFTIRTIRWPNENSISNMPLLKSKPHGHKVMDIFENTPPMSTYLVCFIISDFGKAQREEVNSEGKKYLEEIYGRPHYIKKGLGDYAMGKLRAISDFLENYTGTPNPLKKMSHVAIPDKWFIGSAMENWGAVTYRESSLFYEEGVTSQENILLSLCHEYIHQWFGNLLTPSWWNEVWLNEGFATFFEIRIADLLEPNLGSNRPIETFLSALKNDQGAVVDSMTKQVYTRGEIEGKFNYVSYNKGACYWN